MIYLNRKNFIRIMCLSNTTADNTYLFISIKLFKFNYDNIYIYQFRLQKRDFVDSIELKIRFFFSELLVIFGVLILVLFGLSGLKSLWNVFKKKCVKRQLDDTTAMKQPSKRRVKAIDTIRG